MSSFEKTIERLLSRPKDFTWREVQFVMSHFGYYEIKGSGSRRRFIGRNRVTLRLHEPHPKKIIKPYAIKIIIYHLQNENHI